MTKGTADTWKAPDIVHLGPRVAPVVVRHAELGYEWTVVRLLED